MFRVEKGKMAVLLSVWGFGSSFELLALPRLRVPPTHPPIFIISGANDRPSLERPGISGHELNPGSFERDWIRANSRRFVRVCDQKGIREIRDIKIRLLA
jgi:hypothetical protein